MNAILRKLAGVVAVIAAILLAADARSASPSGADVTVGSLTVGHALAERHAEVRAAPAPERAKAPCPFCPKRAKVKACAAAPCPPTPALADRAGPIRLAGANAVYSLPEVSARKGIDWPPDPPPPKNLS